MTREQFGKLRFKAHMFGSLTNGGHLQSYECEEIPEFMMTNIKKDRKSNWKRTFQYKGVDYDDKEAAFEAMKDVELNTEPAR